MIGSASQIPRLYNTYDEMRQKPQLGRLRSDAKPIRNIRLPSNDSHAVATKDSYRHRYFVVTTPGQLSEPRRRILACRQSSTPSKPIVRAEKSGGIIADDPRGMSVNAMQDVTEVALSTSRQHSRQVSCRRSQSSPTTPSCQPDQPVSEMPNTDAHIINLSYNEGASRHGDVLRPSLPARWSYTASHGRCRP
jgi:hypothetical protein